MKARSGQRRPRPMVKPRYGWRDIAAVLGMYALILQIGLGVVAGFAGAAIAEDRQAAGDTIADLALQICSPAGLIEYTGDGAEQDGPRRGIPLCPGCLIGHAGPIPPLATAGEPPQPNDVAPLPVDKNDRPDSLDQISTLNPRAPPTLSA